MIPARGSSGRDAEVAERADATFVIHAGWALERTAGMVSQVRPELVLADSGLPCDTFNIVCRARLAGARGRRAARQAVAHFGRVQRPFSWWVGPADQPGNLGTMLEELGLQRAETELAMALSLGVLPGQIPDVAGLVVRRVRTQAELEAWAEIAAANWTPPDHRVLAFYRCAAPALLDPGAPQWFYVGYLDGEPVATAEAAVQEGTAGLFNISTRSAFRGRGIGSMMTWRPLRDAAAAGCELGVLQAAAAGVGLYRRLGFTPFGEITEYKPRGSALTGPG